MKTEELPNMKGKGVEKLTIKPIDAAIEKYEKKKEARCKMSPGEIAAKQELTELLHKHRDKLPQTPDGVPFYRYEEKDYLLEEKLKIEKVSSDNNEE